MNSMGNREQALFKMQLWLTSCLVPLFSMAEADDAESPLVRVRGRNTNTIATRWEA